MCLLIVSFLLGKQAWIFILLTFIGIVYLFAGQTDRVPVVGEAESLARTLLLSAELDWRRREKQGHKDKRLEQLFCPLLDILHRIDTSVYLPLCKADKSLQLMLRLLLILGKNFETGRENGVLSGCIKMHP